MYIFFLIVCRWNEINNMSHNRSFFAVELSNREESVQFQTVSQGTFSFSPTLAINELC